MAGQNPATFSTFTLREIAIISEASGLRDARLAWQAARYMAYAYHQPNDMPECPGTQPEPGTQSQADAAYVRAWMRAAHNASRNQNGR